MNELKKYFNNEYFYFLGLPVIILIIYFLNPSNVFVDGNQLSFVTILISCFVIEYFIQKAKNGEDIYMRPIPAMNAMEEAVGRATEMGSSVLYVPGISGLDEIDTIQEEVSLWLNNEQKQDSED